MPNYKSQKKQDEAIDFLFQKKNKGTFLDIGAHDGITFSNSYFFEKYRKWSGICVEPNPDVFKNLSKNRNCILENCCVSKKEQIVTFRKVEGYPEMLSGILEFFDQAHINRIDNEIQRFGGAFRDIKVECKTLNSISAQYNMFQFDYVSIDTEGAELEIIESIDFNKINISAFSIENNNKDASVKNVLIHKDYLYVGTLGADDFFIKKGVPRYHIFQMYIFFVNIKGYYIRKFKSLANKLRRAKRT